MRTVTRWLSNDLILLCGFRIRNLTRNSSIVLSCERNSINECTFFKFDRPLIVDQSMHTFASLVSSHGLSLFVIKMSSCAF